MTNSDKLSIELIEQAKKCLSENGCGEDYYLKISNRNMLTDDALEAIESGALGIALEVVND